MPPVHVYFGMLVVSIIRLYSFHFEQSFIEYRRENLSW